MKLFAIPILFTAIVLLIGFFLTWAIPHGNRDHKWEHWDTVFVSTLMIAVVLPTWAVYLSPHWPIPLFWTIVAVLVSYFAPHTIPPGLTTILNKSTQYTIAGVSITIAWMTFMMIFVETHWRHAT